jgi:hypothetical protein
VNETHPVSRGKINSFSEVIALVKASMVSSRESDDKFSGMLVGADNLRKNI